MKNKDMLKQLRDMSEMELSDKCKELKEEIFNIRFKLVTDHSGDFTRIKYNKRQIARINTIVREREMLKELETASN